MLVSPTTRCARMVTPAATRVLRSTERHDTRGWFTVPVQTGGINRSPRGVIFTAMLSDRSQMPARTCSGPADATPPPHLRGVEILGPADRSEPPVQLQIGRPQRRDRRVIQAGAHGAAP